LPKKRNQEAAAQPKLFCGAVAAGREELRVGRRKGGRRESRGTKRKGLTTVEGAIELGLRVPELSNLVKRGGGGGSSRTVFMRGKRYGEEGLQIAVHDFFYE